MDLAFTKGVPMKRWFLLITLLLALGTALSADLITVANHPNEVRLTQSTPTRMELELTLGQFNTRLVNINGGLWHELSLDKEGLTLDAGYPQLPVLARSVIIPNTARMEISLVESEYVELPMRVAPSKGNLTRDIDPADIPYRFAEVYGGTGPWPAEPAWLTEPFILRDFRGITVRFQPFAYLPDRGILRVYTRLSVALEANGSDPTNALPESRSSWAEEFAGIYGNMFLNFNPAKYPSLGEQGGILAIKHPMFDAVMQPWVEWKRQNGFRVEVADMAEAGPSANDIMAFIQSRYDLGEGLSFVQIFGDAPQVPTLSSGGGGSDPSYALVAGTDSYPDIYIGRFSAQTEAEMQTQIERSIYYERDFQAGNAWLELAMGIASNEGGGGQGDMGESDQQHVENIRADLLGYGYQGVDQLYQTTFANATQVGANLNAGRGFVNYTGHGSTTSWGTTGFSNTHVNNLVNDNRLPFINSVACVNGNFVGSTCFAEAWLRAVNEATNAPAGAIGIYASSINQSWNPPMRAQDETVDLLAMEAKQTLGGLFFNGSAKMIEVYGANGVSMYKTWHIFGDASLMVRSKDPQPVAAVYDPVLFLGATTFMVETDPGARVTLSANGTVYATGTADASGFIVLDVVEQPQEPMDLALTITAFNKVTHLGSVRALPNSGPYLVVAGITVSDANNQAPEFGETITVNVNLNNVGSDPASGVSVALSSQDEYLAVLDAGETIGDIDAHGSGGTVSGFRIQIAGNVPDQHVAKLHITAAAGTETYEYDRELTLNAPAFAWGGLSIDDSPGNLNGMIDPGETVNLGFSFLNTGHADAQGITTALAINGATHIAAPVQTSFTNLPVGGEARMEYQVTFSSQIPSGSMLIFETSLLSGAYAATQNYSVNAGLVVESFETNFAAMDWTFSGGDWSIVPESFNGSNAVRSATIGDNLSTSMSVTLDCPAVGVVSFWKKVSSEAYSDCLYFHVNNQMRNQWSGTTDSWSQVTFNVPPGINTFTWSYVKNGSNSAGSDCAWIDDIVFPSSGIDFGTPVISLGASSLDFGKVLLGEAASLPFQIQNSGDAVLIGSVAVDAPFTVSQGDATAGNSIPILVPAQSVVTINLNFTPAEETSYNLPLHINTDDPANPALTVDLLGTGYPLAADDAAAPAVTELKGNYPNPFNPSTTIVYSVKESTPVLIEIYNLKGQLVRVLVDESKIAGKHEVVFDGLDDNRSPLASGVYLYRMKAGAYVQSQKMILLK